jgi:hypothetical protein
MVHPHCLFSSCQSAAKVTTHYHFPPMSLDVRIMWAYGSALPAEPNIFYLWRSHALRQLYQQLHVLPFVVISIKEITYYCLLLDKWIKTNYIIIIVNL